MQCDPLLLLLHFALAVQLRSGPCLAAGAGFGVAHLYFSRHYRVMFPVQAIYDAAFDEQLFPGLIRQIAEYFGAQAGYIAWMSEPDHAGFQAEYGNDPIWLQRYMETYAPLDILRPALMAAPEAEPQSAYALLQSPDVQASRFYREYIAPQGVVDNLAVNLIKRDGLVLLRDDGRVLDLGPEVERMTGYTSTDVASRSPFGRALAKAMTAAAPALHEFTFGEQKLRLLLASKPLTRNRYGDLSDGAGAAHAVSVTAVDRRRGARAERCAEPCRYNRDARPPGHRARNSAQPPSPYLCQNRHQRFSRSVPVYPAIYYAIRLITKQMMDAMMCAIHYQLDFPWHPPVQKEMAVA